MASFQFASLVRTDREDWAFRHGNNGGEKVPDYLAGTGHKK
jgi:hypothetical protein